MLMQPFAGLEPTLREMERLRREMNRLFADMFTSTGLRAAPAYPAVNVWMNDNGALVTAELPGCTLDNIEITVVDDTLTLKGSRPEDELPEGATYHRRERACGTFSRLLTLPFKVDADKAEAKFEKGVLEIKLPRAEEDKPKRITVKTA